MFSWKRKPAAQPLDLAPDNAFTAFDHGEAVVLDLKGNRFYGLNETATFILRELRAGKAISALESEYRAHYGVDEAVARRDIVTCRDALMARNLLSN